MPYVALKGAIAVFTKNVAKTYGRAGVRANCVCPGAIETGGLAALRTQIATARGIPEEGVLEQVMVDEWHMDVALGSAREARRSRGAVRVPPVATCRLCHRCARSTSTAAPTSEAYPFAAPARVAER